MIRGDRSLGLLIFFGQSNTDLHIISAITIHRVSMRNSETQRLVATTPEQREH